MTKLVKKSVDVEKILEKPHQTWTERLINYVFSKTAIASIYFMIMGWCSKAFSEERWIAQTVMPDGGIWGIQVQKVTMAYQNTRKFIFITGFFLMLIWAVLALFKKVSWFFLWCILSWLGFVMATGMIIDSLVGGFDPIYLPFIMVGIILFFLPLLISFIQYKHKKIEKKLFKKRFLIWIAPLCALFVSLIIFR